jgi:y4mF family transcriptional regulator
MQGKNFLLNAKIQGPSDIGKLVREQRRKSRMTQAETASLCGVGVRFLSNLESGKPSVELGLVLKVLSCLGLEVSIQSRHWSHEEDD